MPRTSDAKQRMIESAALLQRERGIHGTAFSNVLEHSGAPRGSIYHHFPGGKSQLATESTAHAASVMTELLRASLAQGDPLATLDLLVRYWEHSLADRDFDAGCPVAAAAVDSEVPEGAREAAAAGFAEWESLLAEAFVAGGTDVDAERARNAASFVIASVEGALLLCRASRSIEPLQRVAAELRRYAAGVLEG